MARQKNGQNPTADMEDRLKERVQLSMLYDFYGPLLHEKNRQIFEAYVQEDYSITEIAEELGVSRQAVHDAVKRTTRRLQEYEKKLGLLARFDEQRREAAKLSDCLRRMHISQETPEGQEVYRILERILE